MAWDKMEPRLFLRGWSSPVGIDPYRLNGDLDFVIQINRQHVREISLAVGAAVTKHRNGKLRKARCPELANGRVNIPALVRSRAPNINGVDMSSGRANWARRTVLSR